MQKLLTGSALALCALLAACSGAADRKVALQDGIPLVNIIREPSGKETVLTGTIQPRINFTSRFSTQSDTGVKCEGAFNNRGIGTIECNNGWRINLAIPSDKYGTLHGTYIETVDGIGTAVGWGDEADADRLRGLM